MDSLWLNIYRTPGKMSFFYTDGKFYVSQERAEEKKDRVFNQKDFQYLGAHPVTFNGAQIEKYMKGYKND